LNRDDGKSLRPDSSPGHTLHEGADGAVVCRPSPGDEFQSAENVHILETWNTGRDTAVSIARARLGPGKETETHLLRTTQERYLIDSGKGEVRIGTMEPRKVARGDVVFIPANVSQSIRNTGATDLVFYCICTPPFDADNYQSLSTRMG
jgi:mannose-6-phosphate isomerase-like protein (cupin superfamily)